MTQTPMQTVLDDLLNGKTEVKARIFLKGAFTAFEGTIRQSPKYREIGLAEISYLETNASNRAEQTETAVTFYVADVYCIASVKPVAILRPVRPAS